MIAQMDVCSRGCGYPMDPALNDMGLDAHPACESGDVVTPLDVLNAMRATNREFNREHPNAPPGASMRLWLPERRGRRGIAADVERRPHNRPQVLTSSDDMATQMRAARDALPRAGTVRRKVYDVILSAGRRGLTHDELSNLNGRSYSLNGPRVRELMLDGHVIRAPRTRTASSGSQQDVWCATVNVPERLSPTQREDDHEN